jgi:pyruvate dehydrogenase E2 component (dihydrolipoamide acetyltransferase)
MPIEVTMPRLSDTMEQGTIVAWNVKEGDKISAGDTLGDIETDKATMELQSFDEGTVAAILLETGKSVAVGSAILVIAEEGEDVAQIKAQYASGAPAKAAAPAGPAKASDAPTASSAPAPAPAAPAAPANEAGHGDPGARVFASPLARKLAAERGVDLASLSGTGPSGRIVRRDVEAAGASASTSVAAPAASRAGSSGPAPLPAPGASLEGRTIALSNMRATIAKRLVESKQTVPHYQVTVSVNMDPLLQLREQLNTQLATQNVKLSVNDFLVRACALAMHQHPYVNTSWGADGKSVVQHARINVGVAIALPVNPDGTGGGLVVATLRDADQIGLRVISSETRRLAKKAREKGLSIEEMSDATFTISNLGMYGVEHFTAIINPPNAAILAVGAAIAKPVVRDGQIVIGHEMQMTISSDHRVIDGAMAAQYLQTVKALLEAPASLLV